MSAESQRTSQKMKSNEKDDFLVMSVTSIQSVKGRNRDNVFGLGQSKPSKQTPGKNDQTLESPWKDTPNFLKAKQAMSSLPEKQIRSSRLIFATDSAKKPAEPKLKESAKKSTTVKPTQAKKVTGLSESIKKNAKQ